LPSVLARAEHTLSTSRLAGRAPAGVRHLTVVVLALIGLGGGVSSQTPDLFDEVYARTRAVEAKRQTVRARFTQTSMSSLLVKPMVAKGTLVGAKPARLLMTYTSPERKTILLDGNRLVVIRPDRGESEQVDTTEILKKVNHYFVNADPNQLRSSFTIRTFVDPEMPSWYQLDLIPKRKQIRQGLERLQIWITRDTLFLAQMKMTFPGGDSDTVRIEDAELNIPLGAHAFDADIPPARKK
jgi:outer membrane lipoprotein-sorting protein